MARTPKNAGGPPAEIVDEDPLGVNANAEGAGTEGAGDDVAAAAQALHDSQREDHQLPRSEVAAESPELPESGDDEDDHVAQMERALARLGGLIDKMQLSGGTLVCDVRDTLLDLWKHRQKLWTECSQHEKRDISQALEGCAQRIVKAIAEEVAKGARPAIRAVGGNVTIGDKVEMKILIAALPEDEMASTLGELYHLKGKTILLMSADDAQFNARRRESVKPDEVELPFVEADDEGGEGADADREEGDGQEGEEVEGQGDGEGSAARDAEPGSDADG